MASMFSQRFVPSGIAIAAVLTIVLIPAGAQQTLLAPIILPAPHRDGATLKNTPLLHALNERHTTYKYYDQPISPATLSDLLWAAYGVNRPNGKRTTPSPMNSQLVELFLVLPNGIFAWDGANTLRPVVGGDHRAEFGRPPEASAIKIIYVADYSKLKGPPLRDVEAMANVSVGFIGQNVYLFAASEGLGAHFIAGSRDAERLGKLLNLKPDEHVLYLQLFGYGDLNAPEPTRPAGPPPGATPNSLPPQANK
jgi:nitroreductase